MPYVCTVFGYIIDLTIEEIIKKMPQVLESAIRLTGKRVTAYPCSLSEPESSTKTSLDISDCS